MPPKTRYFYPRSPCGERRPATQAAFTRTGFLSTLSLRRATASADCFGKPSLFLSTLSLRRATCAGRPQSGWIDISIHALLAESDSLQSSSGSSSSNFYPRSPCGERPSQCRTLASGMYDFYPRSPCGERRLRRSASIWLDRYFYPRSPCGERPVPQQENGQAATISIHALLAESDRRSFPGRRCPANFYPRSPCGERLHCLGGGLLALQFLSTLSLRRATDSQSAERNHLFYFYPRSPCGERLRRLKSFPA